MFGISSDVISATKGLRTDANQVSHKFTKGINGRFHVAGVSGSFVKSTKKKEEEAKKSSLAATLAATRETHAINPKLEQEIKNDEEKLKQLQEKLELVKQEKMRKEQRIRDRQLKKTIYKAATRIQRSLFQAYFAKKFRSIQIIKKVLQAQMYRQAISVGAWAAGVIKNFAIYASFKWKRYKLKRYLARGISTLVWSNILRTATDHNAVLQELSNKMMKTVLLRGKKRAHKKLIEIRVQEKIAAAAESRKRAFGRASMVSGGTKSPKRMTISGLEKQNSFKRQSSINNLLSPARTPVASPRRETVCCSLSPKPNQKSKMKQNANMTSELELNPSQSDVIASQGPVDSQAQRSKDMKSHLMKEVNVSEVKTIKDKRKQEDLKVKKQIEERKQMEIRQQEFHGFVKKIENETEAEYALRLQKLHLKKQEDMEIERRNRLQLLEVKKRKAQHEQQLELERLELLKQEKIKKKNEYLKNLMKTRQLQAREAAKLIREKELKLKRLEWLRQMEMNENEAMAKEDIRTITILRQQEIEREKKRDAILLLAKQREAEEKSKQLKELEVLKNQHVPSVPRQNVDPNILEAKRLKKEKELELEQLQIQKEEEEKQKQRELIIQKEKIALANRLAERNALEKQKKMQLEYENNLKIEKQKKLEYVAALALQQAKSHGATRSGSHKHNNTRKLKKPISNMNVSSINSSNSLLDHNNPSTNLVGENNSSNSVMRSNSSGGGGGLLGHVYPAQRNAAAPHSAGNPIHDECGLDSRDILEATIAEATAGLTSIQKEEDPEAHLNDFLKAKPPPFSLFVDENTELKSVNMNDPASSLLNNLIQPHYIKDAKERKDKRLLKSIANAGIDVNTADVAKTYLSKPYNIQHKNHGNISNRKALELNDMIEKARACVYGNNAEVDAVGKKGSVLTDESNINNTHHVANGFSKDCYKISPRLKPITNANAVHSSNGDIKHDVVSTVVASSNKRLHQLKPLQNNSNINKTNESGISAFSKHNPMELTPPDLSTLFPSANKTMNKPNKTLPVHNNVMAATSGNRKPVIDVTQLPSNSEMSSHLSKLMAETTRNSKPNRQKSSAKQKPNHYNGEKADKTGVTDEGDENFHVNVPSPLPIHPLPMDATMNVAYEFSKETHLEQGEYDDNDTSLQNTSSALVSCDTKPLANDGDISSQPKPDNSLPDLEDYFQLSTNSIVNEQNTSRMNNSNDVEMFEKAAHNSHERQPKKNRKNIQKSMPIPKQAENEFINRQPMVDKTNNKNQKVSFNGLSIEIPNESNNTMLSPVVDNTETLNQNTWYDSSVQDNVLMQSVQSVESLKSTSDEQIMKLMGKISKQDNSLLSIQHSNVNRPSMGNDSMNDQEKAEMENMLQLENALDLECMLLQQKLASKMIS